MPSRTTGSVIDVLGHLEQEARLSELNEQLRAFNVFDALGIARREFQHSNFLAWLLNPSGSHGQGALFLRAILDAIGRQATLQGSKIELENCSVESLGSARVRREWKCIDLVLEWPNPKPTVIAIEHKIDADLYNNLRRYKKVIETDFAEYQQHFVVLSRTGATSQNWIPFRYDHLHAALTDCIDTNKGAISGEVQLFLKHYIALIGSRFMDNAEIDRRCREIYSSHQMALDEIFRRICRGQRDVMSNVRKVLEQKEGQWHVTKRYAKGYRVVDFVPQYWRELLSVGKSRFRHWVTFGFSCKQGEGSTRLVFWLWVWETAPIGVRNEIINCLALASSDSRINPKKAQGGTSLVSEKVLEWDSEMPSRATIEDTVQTTLDTWYDRMQELTAQIAAIVDSHAAK